MFNRIIITCITTLFIHSTLCADLTEGEELFHEGKCLECHNVKDFSVRKEKVNSFKKLHNTVSTCAFNSDVGWFDDETMDVVKYLDSKYYHFNHK